MSPRAAWRLESYGFERVYDYVPGKADWLAFNLPRHGWARLAGDVLTRDLPTASVHDRLGDVRTTLCSSNIGLIVVLNHQGIVIGILPAATADQSDDTAIGAIMDEGPTTIRPSEEVEPLVEAMRDADVDGVLVTSSDGKLLGLFERSRGENALSENIGDDRPKASRRWAPAAPN